MDIDRVTWHYDDDDDDGGGDDGGGEDDDDGDAGESHVRKVKEISGINHEKIWVLKPNKNEKKKVSCVLTICWCNSNL